MYSRQLKIFDRTQYLPRKPLSQLEFESAISDYTHAIINIFESAFSMMLEEAQGKKPNYFNRNWHSVVMNGNIQGLLLDYFGPEKIRFGPKGRFYLHIPGISKIYFKKLDNRKRPQNVITENDQLIKKQLTDDIDDLSSNIFIGYVVNSLWSEIKGIHAVSLSDYNDLNWIVDFDELRQKTITERIRLEKLERAEPQPDLKLRVAAKKKAKPKKTGGNK